VEENEENHENLQVENRTGYFQNTKDAKAYKPDGLCAWCESWTQSEAHSLTCTYTVVAESLPFDRVVTIALLW
jgi:hypothetical protein